METLRNTTSNLRAALAAAEKGYRCIPLLPGSKTPAVRWKVFQTVSPTESQYFDWFTADENVAVLTGDVVVFDCETPNVVDLVLDQCGKTPTMTKTPGGGFHLWYRKRKGILVGNRVRIKNEPIDVRAEGGLAIIPPSRTEKGSYAWLGELLPANELPVARIGWTRERVRPLKPIEPVDDANVMVRRARAYLAHVEGAIAGQRGHDRTMRVAGVLIQKFRLSIEQAFPLFLEWSETSCEPPWSEMELLHKLQDAYRLRFRFSTGGR